MNNKHAILWLEWNDVPEHYRNLYQDGDEEGAILLPSNRDIPCWIKGLWKQQIIDLPEGKLIIWRHS